MSHITIIDKVSLYYNIDGQSHLLVILLVYAQTGLDDVRIIIIHQCSDLCFQSSPGIHGYLCTTTDVSYIMKVVLTLYPLMAPIVAIWPN